jgi:hypothetical protein
MIIIYVISQVVMRFFSPQKPQPSGESQQPVTYDQSNPDGQAHTVNPLHLDPQFINAAWPIGTTVALHVYVSQSFGYDMFAVSERKENGKLPSVVWNNLTWGDWSWSRSAAFEVDIPAVRLAVIFSSSVSLTCHRQSRIMVHCLPTYS